jgi:transcriptional regulator with XRE-family HTH domain
MLERKRVNADYKKLHDETYAAFKLENQILIAMEDRGMSYSDLALATHTSKSNVSRDLRAGGILNASLARIGRIADALGMKLIVLLVPKESDHKY